MVTTLKSPRLASSRPFAHEFMSGAPADLTGHEVIIDCENAEAAAPSFVDELVKIVLVIRKADSLKFVRVPTRTASVARRSADRRGVADRLAIEEREEPAPA